MTDIKYLILIVFLLYIIFNNLKSQKNIIKKVDLEDAKDNIENSVYDLILDIRTIMEKSIGGLTIAKHISLEDLLFVENLIPNKNQNILVVSKNSQRAELFAEYISFKGYKNVSFLNDHWTKLA